MDAVMDLINQFKAEETNKLDKIDNSRKPTIISSLEDSVDDDRVAGFLLTVAADEIEYDLARIEAFKVFEIKDFTDSGVRSRIGRVIRDVLANSKVDDVRNYAAMAAASYMDIEGVFEQIERILQNKQENSDLRWNAFAAIKSIGASSRTIDSLRRLLVDDEFVQSATRVLSEWHAE